MDSPCCTIKENIVVNKRWNQDPQQVALLNLIKSCGKQKDLQKIIIIHADILRTSSVSNDIYVSTALISAYAKCGNIAKAHEIFNGLRVQSVVCWNSLISGYVLNGHGKEAFTLLARMQAQGLSPNAVTFACILKACSSMRLVKQGEQIHTEVIKRGLLKDSIVVGNALVDMYAKFGMLVKALEVFRELQRRDVITWNILISGYVQCGFASKALECFNEMLNDGLSPDSVTFACILKACGSIGAIEKGEQIHAEIRKQGLLNKGIVLGTSLVDMYAKCGLVNKAQQVFDVLPVRNVVTWNALITGYAQHGLSNEALNCFARMQNEGFSPNAVTYAIILKACGSLGLIEKGEEIHAEVRKQGLLKDNIILGNALVDLYAKCNFLARAQEFFDALPIRNVISWNALIAGYVQGGHNNEALDCFQRMQDEGIFPDTITFACTLKACRSIGSLEKGEEIHNEIGKQGLLDKNPIMLGTALVDMYAKCGALAKAQEVFDKLSIQTVASWNALISGYSFYGLDDDCLNCFVKMQETGLSPNAITFTYLLKACGNVGSVEMGDKMHTDASKAGFLENNSLLVTALMDMYAKCGVLGKAEEVFQQLSIRDAVSWTALITGYAQLGRIQSVFLTFKRMIAEGIIPDAITFVALLNACNHAGLVEEGQCFFNTMTNIYLVSPTSEHYTCMVDLFSRAGHFDKAIIEINRAPHSDRFQLWFAFLGACQKWHNVELGRWAFEHSKQLNEKNAAIYTCMSNMYAAAGLQKEADKVEALGMENGAFKISGDCWWIGDNGNMHSFTVAE